MTWARFDDNYDSHPKILRAGLHGKSLHATSIRWSRRHKTDGKILKTALIQVGALAQVPTSRIKSSARLLVDLRLWEDRGDYWFIHDFEKYGPPASWLSRGQRHDDVVAPATAEPLHPLPVPVSLNDLRERASGRGVAADSLSGRLARLRQRVESKGVEYWIPYVLKPYKPGVACLFDQEVGRWLEEDHAARKGRETPPAFPLPSKALPA